MLPAREVADTIGPILAALVPLRDAGLLDELLVIDAASADGTAAIAARGRRDGRAGGGGAARARSRARQG